MKARILLIYTGGTIGMMKDPMTGALKTFNFDQLLKYIPEINLLDCTIETHSFENPIDSSNMKPDYWVQLVEIIEKEYDRFDGFVILHGSDTMSYTASAISFMLENLTKPIIFTGSQLPIGDLRTDAKENLITSLQIASLCDQGVSKIQEVCIYFEYKLYRANRTTKISAAQFEAFDSLNYPPLAESGVRLFFNEGALWKNNSREPLKVQKTLETQILLIKLFPGLEANTLEHLLSYPNLKGVVLETFGSGNATDESWLLECLEKTIGKGIPVVNITQCVGGGVEMGLYETSRGLEKIGLISGGDMTTEAAITKMMYLLGKLLKGKNFKEMFETPIRGEITKI